MAMSMSRRPINPSRRISERGLAIPSSSLHTRSRSPYLTIAATILGAFLLLGLGLVYRGTGGTFGNDKSASRVEDNFSCTAEVLRTIPSLKEAYGNSMHKILHVGPDSCSVVSKLLKEEETEAWGVEPYDVEEIDRSCKRLVHKGVVRVADIKFPLPYKAKSFSLVIASDALDYLSPKYLNRTVPELARVSSDGLVIFAGYPRHHKIKAGEKVVKYGRQVKWRTSTWWIRFFVQMSLEENEIAIKKFEKAVEKISYSPRCQIFHTIDVQLKRYYLNWNSSVDLELSSASTVSFNDSERSVAELVENKP